MKNILTRLTIFGTLLFSTLAFSVGVSANANVFQPCNTHPNLSVCQSVGKQNSGSGNPIIRVLKAATEVIGFITGGLAVIFIVISAIKFITAAGSAEGVASARNSLIYALVGIAVSALAGAIVEFVLNKL